MLAECYNNDEVSVFLSSMSIYDGPIPYHPSRKDLGPLQAALFLALLIHTVVLLVLTVTLAKDNDEGFFSALEHPVKLREVDLVRVKPEPKPVVTPPPPRRQVATTPPPTVAPVPPRVPSAVPGPKGPAKAPRQPGGGRPKVLGARDSRWSVPSGEGYNGTGPGKGGGPGGPGKGWGGGDGPGGPGTSGGPPPPPSTPQAPGEFTIAAPMYFSFNKCSIQDPGPQLTRNMPSFPNWEAFCQYVGTITWDELKTRPRVEPFLVSHRNPSLDAAQALRGKHASLTVRTTIYANGTTRSELAGTTGDKAVDRVGYAIAQSEVWLPALEMGRPVDATVEYVIQFGTYQPDTMHH